MAVTGTGDLATAELRTHDLASGAHRGVAAARVFAKDLTVRAAPHVAFIRTLTVDLTVILAFGVADHHVVADKLTAVLALTVAFGNARAEKLAVIELAIDLAVIAVGANTLVAMTVVFVELATSERQRRAQKEAAAQDASELA